MDFNKLKIYGFPRHLTKFNIYNPAKVRYLNSKDFGYFEAPKRTKSQELKYLVDRYKQRVEYEKYMNPHGLKLTWTSRLPKTGDTIDFMNPKFYLVRSGKEYEADEIKFLVDNNMSKDEIKQFFEKMYKIKVNNVSTSILPGEVKSHQNERKRSFYRTKDKKKAVLKLDFNVDEKYRKL